MFDKFEKHTCPFPMIREGQFMELEIHRLPFLSFFKKNFSNHLRFYPCKSPNSEGERIRKRRGYIIYFALLKPGKLS